MSASTSWSISTWSCLGWWLHSCLMPSAQTPSSQEPAKNLGLQPATSLSPTAASCPILTNSSDFHEVNLSSCIASELQKLQSQSQSSTDPLPHSSALGLSQSSPLSGSSLSAMFSEEQHNLNSQNADSQQTSSRWTWEQNIKRASNPFIFPLFLFMPIVLTHEAH